MSQKGLLQKTRKSMAIALIFFMLASLIITGIPNIVNADTGIQPKWFQNFETAGSDGTFGIAGQGSATQAATNAGVTAAASSTKSVKIIQNTYGDSQNGAWDTGVYSVFIAPQDESKVSGQSYFDASGYNYFIFYARDDSNGANNNVHVTMKDAGGKTWDFGTPDDQKTVQNQWVKIVVTLDKTQDFDFSKITEIRLGEYWGWNNIYYYDDLYFAQNADDPAPASISVLPVVIYNDFENNANFTAGADSQTIISNDCPNENETKSVRMDCGISNWPNVVGNYIDIAPGQGSSFNALGFNYLAFYVKDTQGNNGVEVTITDADGNTLHQWIDKGVQNVWTKLLFPLSGQTGIDLSRITSIRLGQYNSGTYYFDDIYFAKNAADNIPGFAMTQKKEPVWFQNFEFKGADNQYGVSAGNGAVASIAMGHDFSANPYNSSSVKLQVNESITNGYNAVIKPQALAASLTDNQFDYQQYFDATGFNRFIFHVLDAAGNQNVHVVITDMAGGVWAFDTSAFGGQKTAVDAWTKFIIPIDTESSSIDLAKIRDIELTVQNPGTYYLDEFYFAKNTDDYFPNQGYTQFNYESVNNEIVPYQNGIPYASFEKQKSREYLTLGGDWKKQRTTLDSSKSLAKRDQAGIDALAQESGGIINFTYDDSSWNTKTLPAPEDEMTGTETENPYVNEDGTTSRTGYEGGVWYRKHFTPDASWQGRNIKLAFLGVNYFADVWINGNYVGGHQGGYTPFAFDVGSLLNYGGDNVIAVRVDNPKWTVNGTYLGEMFPYKQSDWFNYTGILRDCYLEASDPAYVVRNDVTTLDTSGNIEIKTVLNNKDDQDKNLTVSYSVYEAKLTDANKASEFSEDLVSARSKAVKDSSGSVSIGAGSVAVNECGLQIKHPRLWSPEDPNLYILKTVVKNGDKVLDTFYTQFGIRTLDTDGEKILLNGKLAPFLVGVGRTEDSPVTGPSMDNSAIYNDFNTIKNVLKANFVRTGHFPANINSYVFTDRIGLACWVEIPAYWFDGNAFNLQTNREQAAQLFAEMVYSNYNRPSIWFNGTTNESSAQLERVNYIKQMHDVADQIDGTRLIGQSAAAKRWSPSDSIVPTSDMSHTTADVIGMTMYYGVFYGSNADQETQEEIEDISRMHPGKPILATEYGYWSSADYTLEPEQIKIFTGTFNAFAQKATWNEEGTPNRDGILSGAAWWCAFDWYTNITGIQTMGLLHMDRQTEKMVTDVLAERYSHYSHVASGSKPSPQGITNMLQSFDGGSGSVTVNGSTAEVSNDTWNSISKKSILFNTQGLATLEVKLGGIDLKNISVYNYLNFYVKDMQKNEKISVTLVDKDGKTWTANTANDTVKGKWTRVSVPIGKMTDVEVNSPGITPESDAASNLSELIKTNKIKAVRINVTGAGKYYFDDFFLSTCTNDACPAVSVSEPGLKVAFQNFENNPAILVGSEANAGLDVQNFADMAGSQVSAKLEVLSSGDPGNASRCFTVGPQNGASVDTTGTDYLIFYVKDTQGSNTVHAVVTDTQGNSWSGWVDTVKSIKNEWVKVYLPLSNITGIDKNSVKSITLGEWNSGVYYFDEISFAKSLADDGQVFSIKPAAITDIKADGHDSAIGSGETIEIISADSFTTVHGKLSNMDFIDVRDISVELNGKPARINPDLSFDGRLELKAGLNDVNIKVSLKNVNKWKERMGDMIDNVLKIVFKDKWQQRFNDLCRDNGKSAEILSFNFKINFTKGK